MWTLKQLATKINEAFTSLCQLIGLMPEEAKLIFLGLDNAGKSTLLHMLKTDRLGAMNPTQHHSTEEFTVDGRLFVARDMGGHAVMRRIWKDYLCEGAVDGIFFLVDSADRTRLEEARIELHRLLALPGLANVPI